ncbi:hypothetical protein [Flavobacterium sp.]|uniref:hypothetical protein n=2 Tax=Flavobacterium sp. TaxID=239 RepID=UPI004048707D
MSESILHQLLKKSKETKELLSVWQYNAEKGSLVGYVVDFNDEFIVFNQFTKFGKPDGKIILNLSSVKTIDYNDDYTKVMECLIQYSDVIDKPLETNIPIEFIDQWQFETLKHLITMKDQIASFEINGGDFYTGFVKKLSNEDFVLQCIGKNGEDQGNALYKIEDITEIRLDDMDDKRRLLLYKWRNAII